MTEKQPGPAPGIHLIEVSVKRELTVSECFIESDTSLICHVLVHCFGSFLLQDTNVCLCCDAGPGCSVELFASTVGRFLSWASYLPSNIFLRRCCSFNSRKLYACLEKFLCFSCTI